MVARPCQVSQPLGCTLALSYTTGRLSVKSNSNKALPIIPECNWWGHPLRDQPVWAAPIIRCMFSGEKYSGIGTVPARVPRNRSVSPWCWQRATSKTERYNGGKSINWPPRPADHGRAGKKFHKIDQRAITVRILPCRLAGNLYRWWRKNQWHLPRAEIG